MSTPLHIQLLGTCQLVHGAIPLAIGHTPRLQALLAYLLLHRATPQPRQQLAFLLWPDSPDTQARTNLRKLLHQLRHTLPATERFVADDGATLQWQPNAPFTLDVVDFEGALAAAEQAEQTGDQGAVRAALEQTVARYGGPLLPTCYDDW